MSTYTPTDGITRYNPSPNNFCTGDTLASGTTSPITTSYDLRMPTDTYNPINGSPITACEKQYQGIMQSTENTTTPANGRPAPSRSSWPRAPTPACGPHQAEPEVQHDVTGDDQRTRAGLSPVGDALHLHPDRGGRLLPADPHQRRTRRHADGEGGTKDNPNVFTQTGDDNTVHGHGNNRFAIRAKGARGLRLHRRLPAHVDLRQLQRRQHHVQPGARDPGRGDQDPQHRLLRRRRREQPAPSRCCRRSR